MDLEFTMDYRISCLGLMLSLMLTLGSAATMADTLLINENFSGPKTLPTNSNTFTTNDGYSWQRANWPSGAAINGTVYRRDNVAIVGDQLLLSLNGCGSANCAGTGYSFYGAEVRTLPTGASGPMTGDYFGTNTRVEASMKAASGNGVVTALFRYQSDDNPHHEIDVEILGKNTDLVELNYFTYEMVRDVNGNPVLNDNGEPMMTRVGHVKSIDLGFDAAEGFHTYAFESIDNILNWYVDGEQVHSAEVFDVDNDNAPLTLEPGRIMMSLWAVNGNGTGWAGTPDLGLNTTAEFDWIKVSAVPIPAAAWLFISALAPMAWITRRRHSRSA